MRTRILAGLTLVLAVVALPGAPARAQGTWVDLGGSLPGTSGAPALVGTGPLVEGLGIALSLTNAKPGSPAALFVSLGSTPVPLKGGVLLAFPAIIEIPVGIPVSGALSLPAIWPVGLPEGTEVFVQYLIKDSGAVHGVALSNGVRAVTLGPTDQFLYLSGKYQSDPDFALGANDPVQFDATTIASDVPGEITNWLAKVTGNTLHTLWAMHVWECQASSGDGSNGPFVAVDAATQDVYVSVHIQAPIGDTVRFYDATSPSPVSSYVLQNDNQCFLLKYSKDGVFQWQRHLRATPIDNPFATPRVMSTRRNLVVLPGGNVVMAVGVRCNGNDGASTTLMLGGGAIEETVAGFFGTSGGGPVQGALLEVDPSGAFVSAKRSEILEPSSGLNSGTIIARDTGSGLYVVHILSDALMRLGQGEANEFVHAPLHLPFELDSFARPNMVKYDLSKELQWAADTRFVFSGGTDAGGVPMGIAVDASGAVYQAGMRKDPTTPVETRISSGGWSVPTASAPLDSMAFVERPYYAKHDASGAAKWVKVYGDSSSFGSSFDTRPIGDIVVDDADQPWICGVIRAGDTIVLDEGLGSQVTLAAGSGALPRAYLARLNPATGSVVDVVTFNAIGAGDAVFNHGEIASDGNGDYHSPGMFNLCRMVPSRLAVGLDYIRAPLLAGATTLTPAVNKGVAVITVTDTSGAVLVAKQFPTGGQSVGTDVRIISVTPSKL